jgi:flagellar export protein FliJ
MKKYRFRLEALLRMRGLAEKDALRDLARALRELDQVEERIEGLDARRRQVLAALEADPGTPVDAPGLLLAVEQLEALDRLRERAGRERARVLLAVDEERKKVQRRQSDRKAMESLDDKARAEHDLLLGREDLRLMDEVAAGARFRRGPPGDPPK